MERSNFFTDQDVLQEDLNNIESSKGNQLKYRAQYILGASGGVRQDNPLASASVERGGIYYNTILEVPPGPVGSLKYKEFFKPEALSATSIRILEGAALDPNGEVIINPATIDMTKGSTGANYDWSTASPGEIQWYVKLRYAAASGSFKSDDLGTSYPTRYTDSFIINVDYTEPTDDDILIASFQGTGAGNITGSIVDERSFVRIITPANAVILDPSTVPVTAHLTAEDHITSVGSGVASDTNPHGLSPDDIGVSNTVEPHRKEAHTPGIIDVTGEYIDSAAFRDSYLGTPTDLGADVEISWTSPNSNARLMVNGIHYSTILTTVSLVDHPDMIAGGDTIYWLYFDNTSASVYNVRATTSNLDDYKTADKLLLCKIQRISGGSDYSNFEDLRRFYGTSQKHIGPDLDENATFDTLNRVSSLENNLNRIRYQLGLALIGIGSSWDGFNPLTSGPTSSAVSYHYHDVTPFQFTSNINQTVSYPAHYIRKNVSGELAGIMLHTTSPTTSKKVYLITNYSGVGVPTTVMLATGSMAALEVIGNGLFGGNVIGSDGIFGGDVSAGGSVFINSNEITGGQAAAIPTLTAGSSSDADAFHTHDSLKGPASGSVVSGYSIDDTRENIGELAMHISAIGLASGNGIMTLYVTEISGSYGANQIFSKTNILSGEYGTCIGVVPPNWFYKVIYSSTLSTIGIQEFPGTGA